jgi:hypothetical protein
VILTAHQPVYLPWLGLFHKIALSDFFCVFDDVQYLKHDWNNRNVVKTRNGPVWLTVPVLTSGYQAKKIREMEIDNRVRWREKHWQTIRYAYGHAPYFHLYADFFEDMYQKEWTSLTELNNHILIFLMGTFGIKVELRHASLENFQGKKSDLVFDMCKKLGADLFIFGALGRNYAKVDDFEAAGIQVYFQDYQHPVYDQLHPSVLHGPFLSHLSAIDLLFNHGDRSLEILMSGNISKPELKHLFGIAE